MRAPPVFAPSIRVHSCLPAPPGTGGRWLHLGQPGISHLPRRLSRRTQQPPRPPQPALRPQPPQPSPPWPPQPSPPWPPQPPWPDLSSRQLAKISLTHIFSPTFPTTLSGTGKWYSLSPDRQDALTRSNDRITHPPDRAELLHCSHFPTLPSIVAMFVVIELEVRRTDNRIDLVGMAQTHGGAVNGRVVQRPGNRVRPGSRAVAGSDPVQSPHQLQDPRQLSNWRDRWMASIDSSSACGPHPNAKPSRDISRSVTPSEVVSSCVGSIALPLPSPLRLPVIIS
jgi:hypothetical protein